MKGIKLLFLLAVVLILLPLQSFAKRYPFTFNDSAGYRITLSDRPQRVISLVPSVTEILMRIGAADSVVGITYHSEMLPSAAGKIVVGGFLQPDIDKVAALEPDLIFYSSLQKEAVARLSGSAVLVQLAASSIEDAFSQISMLGLLFNREEQAAAVIDEQRRQLSIIKSKVTAIPIHERKRVMRIMGHRGVSTPGDDSFQNEFIRAAGGIPPTFGENGPVIPVSLEQWGRFDPQVIYGCGDDRQLLTLLEQPGWRDVEAIRKKQIFFFPCDLTCRPSTYSGFFVSWLSASIYKREFSDPLNFVSEERVVDRKKLPVELDYVENAEIVYSDIKDFRQKTLVVRFTRPIMVVSSLDGQKENITAVANHFFPPPTWGLGLHQGVDSLRKDTLRVIDLDSEKTSMLFTGADMDNVAVVKKRFKEMEVIACVTAGVKSNAMRTSIDEGLFYEPGSGSGSKQPGTINIILLTNMKLSARAMTRAIISATESKTALLQDMDIRSSYSPGSSQATGTGTDNVMVVSGEGIAIDSSGGHTKMGELIGRAVYEGVERAIHHQNGFVRKRSIFQRLKERKINLYEICSRYLSGNGARQLTTEVEKLLLQPRYSNYLVSLMAVSDQYERGLIDDVGSMESWNVMLGAEIAGKEIDIAEIDLGDLPVVLEDGLRALLAGAAEKISIRDQD